MKERAKHFIFSQRAWKSRLLIILYGLNQETLILLYKNDINITTYPLLSL